MEFKEGTHVVTADGKDVGTIDRVVMNPRTKEVTNLIIRQGFLFTEDKVLPVDLVGAATEDRVTLQSNESELPEMPPFEETHYVEIDEREAEAKYPPPSAYPRPLYWYPPLGATRWGYPAPAYPLYPGYPAQPHEVEVEQNIPEGTVALEEGAKVYAADGEHVGDIEEVFTDPETNQATHLLISEGLLLKERKVVPTTWADTIGEGEVHLSVGSGMLDRLQEYKES